MVLFLLPYTNLSTPPCSLKPREDKLPQRMHQVEHQQYHLRRKRHQWRRKRAVDQYRTHYSQNPPHNLGQCLLRFLIGSQSSRHEYSHSTGQDEIRGRDLPILEENDVQL